MVLFVLERNSDRNMLMGRINEAIYIIDINISYS